jgi:hypothetical protein
VGGFAGAGSDTTHDDGSLGVSPTPSDGSGAVGNGNEAGSRPTPAVRRGKGLSASVLALSAAGVVVAVVVGVAVLLVVRHRRTVLARSSVNMATARAVMRPRAAHPAPGPAGTKYVVAANLVSMDAGVLYAPRNKQQSQQQQPQQGAGARSFETLDI